MLRALSVVALAFGLWTAASAVIVLEDDEGHRIIGLTVEEFNLVVEAAKQKGREEASEEKKTGPKSPVKSCIPV